MTRVLVIGGAYGMIGGAEVARDLSGQGVAVTALGRNPMTARKVLPDAAWVFQDLRDLTRPEDWTALIAGGHSHVINCAGGALQDNARDDLSAVHDASIAALATACAEAKVGLIQISAVGGAEASAPRQSSWGGRRRVETPQCVQQAATGGSTDRGGLCWRVPVMGGARP